VTPLLTSLHISISCARVQDAIERVELANQHAVV
jgi:hypothetical protein